MARVTLDNWWMDYGERLKIKSILIEAALAQGRSCITQQGVPRHRISRMAISRQWRDSDGNQPRRAEWFTVVSWTNWPKFVAVLTRRANLL